MQVKKSYKFKKNGNCKIEKSDLGTEDSYLRYPHGRYRIYSINSCHDYFFLAKNFVTIIRGELLFESYN